MRSKIKLFAFLLTGIFFHLSCKKEYSCEGCIGNNKSPIAMAGRDTTITLLIDSVLLDGSKSSDPHGKINKWQWTKIAGPASFQITSAETAIIMVKKLVIGVYQFVLQVTNAGGLFSKDTVQVTVIAVPSNACGDSNRPHISTQLIAVGTLSQPGSEMAVSVGNKILFARNRFTRVDIFDFAANTWSSAELSSKRHGIAAVAAGNKIFFAGGVYAEERLKDVDIYNVSTNTWSLSYLKSTEGDGLAVAATGNKVFFAGGDFGIYATSNVDIYDLTTNTWSTAHLSAARNYITAVSAHDKIYFTGGDPWTGQISSVIDIYDNATGIWSRSTLMVPRIHHAAIAVNDILYFAGGLSQNAEPTCSVETLNTKTGARALMNLSSPSESLDAVAKDNKILFFKEDGTAHDQFDVYDIASNSWSIGVLSYKISASSVISVNNTVYVAGGMINGVLSNKVWKLEL